MVVLANWGGGGIPSVGGVTEVKVKIDPSLRGVQVQSIHEVGDRTSDLFWFPSSVLYVRNAGCWIYCLPQHQGQRFREHFATTAPKNGSSALL
jgi:hypothetical protein